MFYETARRDHGLPHDPFKSIVAPRPIGWISTISNAGAVNLAPYSFFNALSSRPEMVMFSSEGEKDSLANIRANGEFVANHVGAHLKEAMNATSAPAPHGIDEFELAGLDKAACNLVRPPRVALAAAALECRTVQIVELAGLDGRKTGAVMVIGQVVGIHIDPKMLRDGQFDPELAKPIARMGYRSYDGPDGYFEMVRPGWTGAR
jgi:flavin reductase (DIM6/NTAB) family NADH-FMN oxidoreductase RutF